LSLFYQYLNKSKFRSSNLKLIINTHFQSQFSLVSLKGLIIIRHFQSRFVSSALQQFGQLYKHGSSFAICDQFFFTRISEIFELHKTNMQL